MLTIAEFQLLNACANGPEVFYYLFAEVNFGGQILAAFESGGKPHRETNTPRTFEVPGEVVAGYASGLIRSGLMRCTRAPEQVEVKDPDEREFAVYTGYDCLTWQEHIERFGYGPHEFETTDAGLEEIEKPVYEGYIRTLGWW